MSDITERLRAYADGPFDAPESALVEAADEIDRLRAEVESLRKNAERYRFLRDAPATWAPDPMREWMWKRPFGTGPTLDAAIDAAMKP